MRILLYLFIGVVPSFIFAGTKSILIGIIIGLLICIIDLLTTLNEKLETLNSSTIKESK